MIRSIAKLFRFDLQIICSVVFVAVLYGEHSVWAERSLALQVQRRESITPSPGEVLRLFNGRNLSGFSSWLQGVGAEDPNSVFAVVDGTIRISGEGMGYLATVNSYKNYHLSLEYRWGKRTDGSGFVRNSGVLLHANGADGNFKGK